MGILERMEAGVYIIVETQWDTTDPRFHKYIKQMIKTKDKYAQVTYRSYMKEEFINTKIPGGTMLGISGK